MANLQGSGMPDPYSVTAVTLWGQRMRGPWQADG